MEDDVDTRGHYTVEETTFTGWRATRAGILVIRCRHCAFTVSPADFKRTGDRSGLPRYARARAVMVKHLHAEHRSELAAPLARTASACTLAS